MNSDQAQHALLLGCMAYRLGLIDREKVARVISLAFQQPTLSGQELLQRVGSLGESQLNKVNVAVQRLLEDSGGHCISALHEVPLDELALRALANHDASSFSAMLRLLEDRPDDDEFAATADLSAMSRPSQPDASPPAADLDSTYAGGVTTDHTAEVPHAAAAGLSGPGTYSASLHASNSASSPSNGPALQNAVPEATMAATQDLGSYSGSSQLAASRSVEAKPVPGETVELDPDATAAISDDDETGSRGGRSGVTVELDSQGKMPGQFGMLRGKSASNESRYKVLRSHARGGLGEVFVAVDNELNREVALKEIQGQHCDDPISRARFVVEAEVTGGLEHPGIVPVYGLGEYDDGRPYYAMRFIRGESLKDAINRYHLPPGENPFNDAGARELELHKLLRRFNDVCNAMAYSHSRGVLHRDLKPANIMLGPFGETLVVDWGLAKPLDGEPAADGKANGNGGVSGSPGYNRARQTGLTSVTGPGTGRLRPLSASGAMYEVLFGSTVGTPHYMSPEQADGRELGPASDIYSLGATLYTLLTGKTPYSEKALKPLLEKVRRCDFPPPRQVNASVPKPLEAICLKAMSLRTEDRYTTARDLAEDIEHWMADEPVSAYPEPWTARAARWARRHRTAVTTAASLLVVSVVGLGAATYLIEQERARTEKNFVMARSAVDTMLTQLGAVQLADIPGAEGVRRELLEKARDFYLEFLNGKNGKKPTVRQGAGQAFVRVGEVEAELGRYPEAEKSLNQAITLLEPLAAGAGADSEDFRRDLGRAQHDRGVLLTRLARYEDARTALESAVKIRSELAGLKGSTPADAEANRESLNRLGALLGRLAGSDKDARDNLNKAIIEVKSHLQTMEKGSNQTDPEATRDLARYENNLANLMYWSNRNEAASLYGKALVSLSELNDRAKNVPSYAYALARVLNNLGSMNTERISDPSLGSKEIFGEYNTAKGRFKTAYDLLHELATGYPKIPEYRFELAEVLINRARVLQLNPAMKRQDVEDVAKDLTEADKELKELVAQYPGRPDYRLKAADVRRKMALIHRLRSSIDLGEAASNGLAKDSARRRELESRGEMEDRTAISELQASIKDIRAIATSFPEFDKSVDYRNTLGQSIRWLAYIIDNQSHYYPQARRPDLEASLNAMEPDLKEAIGLLESVLRDDPKRQDAADALLICLKGQFDIQLRQSQYSKALETAVALAGKLESASNPSAGELTAVARMIAVCVDRLNDTKVLSEQGPRVGKLLSQAVERGPVDRAEFDRPEYKPIRELPGFQKARDAAAAKPPKQG